jgi:hypothetical protein
LSVDDFPLEPQRYNADHGVNWPQGFLGTEDPTTVRYGVGPLPSIWLIGPDGKVIAKNLHGQTLLDAVRAALGPPAAAPHAN